MHTRRLGWAAAAVSRVAFAVAVPAAPLPLPGTAATASNPAPPPVLAVVREVVGALPGPVQTTVHDAVAAAPAPLAETLTPILFAPPVPPAPVHVDPPPGPPDPLPPDPGVPPPGRPVPTVDPVEAPVGLTELRMSAPQLLMRPVAAAVPAQPPTAPGAGLPDVLLPPGPEGQRMAMALVFLPLLLLTWVLVATRLWRRARAVAQARRRAPLAEQLGLAPADLADISDRVVGRLRDHVVFDDLTGVMRRAAGMAALEREAARARRSGEPLSVVFIDVDGLKTTNDTLGHEAGDNMLRQFAALLRDRVRESDLVFRFGGDEFVVVLPGTRDVDAADFVEQIRVRGEAAGLAFSAGMAQNRDQETAAKMLDRSDRALYVEKRHRRLQRQAAVEPVEEGTAAR